MQLFTLWLVYKFLQIYKDVQVVAFVSFIAASYYKCWTRGIQETPLFLWKMKAMKCKNLKEPCFVSMEWFAN